MFTQRGLIGRLALVVSAGLGVIEPVLLFGGEVVPSLIGLLPFGACPIYEGGGPARCLLVPLGRLGALLGQVGPVRLGGGQGPLLLFGCAQLVAGRCDPIAGGDDLCAQLFIAGLQLGQVLS